MLQALIYDGEKKQFGAFFCPPPPPPCRWHINITFFPENGSEEEHLLNSKDLKKSSSLKLMLTQSAKQVEWVKLPVVFDNCFHKKLGGKAVAEFIDSLRELKAA